MLMSGIYSQWEQVLVWLGPEADGSDELMDAFTTVGEEAKALRLGRYVGSNSVKRLMRILRSEYATTEEEHQIRSLFENTFAVYQSCLPSLVKWYNGPWFTRASIVQEFCRNVNTTLVCGKKRIQAELLMLGHLVFAFCVSPKTITLTRDMLEVQHGMMNDTMGPLFSVRRGIQDAQNTYAGGFGIYDLLRKVYVASQMKATNPGDRIIGLLGLATDAAELAARIDIASQDLVQIFTHTALYIIGNGNLDLLSYSQFPKHISNLPSWVPDWRPGLVDSSCPHSIFPDPNSGTRCVFRASSQAQPSIVLPDGGRKFGLGGYLVDTVEDIGGTWYGMESWDNHHDDAALAQIHLMLRLSSLMECDPIYPGELRREEAVWRIPIGDIDESPSRRRQRATSSETADLYREFLDYKNASEEWKLARTPEEVWKYCDFVNRLMSREGPQSGYAIQYSSLMGKMKGKRPFLTSSKGYVGMGPSTLQPGDVIVVFLGANLPFALRPKRNCTSGDKLYFLLGEAYCDGIMDGEILTNGAAKQTFFLD